MTDPDPSFRVDPPAMGRSWSYPMESAHGEDSRSFPVNDQIIDPRRRFIESYGLKLADHTDITDEILKMMDGRGEKWPWVEKWQAEEAPKWANSDDTLVFEIPPGKLVDRQAVDFAQDAWMMKPFLFEHQTWGGRTFVRMTWVRRSS